MAHTQFVKWVHSLRDERSHDLPEAEQIAGHTPSPRLRRDSVGVHLLGILQPTAEKHKVMNFWV